MNDLSTRPNQSAYVWEIRDSYTANARTYQRFLEENGYGLIDGLGPYFEWLQGQGYRASTVRIKRQAALDRIRRAAKIPGVFSPEQRERIEWIISETVNEAKAPKLTFNGVGRDKVLTLEEYRKTLAVCHSERQRAFLRFLYTTGARVSEIIGIRLTDCVNVLGRVYITVLGKGRKERVLRLTLDQYEAIQAIFKGGIYLFETSAGKPYARQYITGELRKLTLRAIGRPLSAHKMRHSFATRQIGKGVPVDAVSRYLGHSSVSTTLQYYSHTEMTDDQLFDEDL